jgi:hypothetical protein
VLQTVCGLHTNTGTKKSPDVVSSKNESHYVADAFKGVKIDENRKRFSGSKTEKGSSLIDTMGAMNFPDS